MLLVGGAGVLLIASALARAARTTDSTANDKWTPPDSYHYDDAASFRGLTPDGKVEHYDVAGHATVLPGVHDFIRLVPPTPLAHGALFARSPIKYKQWIVEVAFRVHGPPTTSGAGGETGEDGQPKRLHKGGRGLAFWYTKNGLPGDPTISSDPKTKVSPPPPIQPDTPRDKHDSDVSLFGSRTSFDGLGIVFDTSPTAPVWRRSDQLVHADVASVGRVGLTGVVSGIMDDGSQAWLDPEGQVPKGEDEAAYLAKAIGECEAAFRNAQGLLWARIAHYNSTIRVDLDLSPHTTLAKAGRHYEHNCFTIDGINLPAGARFGVSGLASANTEPDTIDVYAMDVFELREDGAPVVNHEEPVDAPTNVPLEGTSNDATETLAHEIFLSQTKMIESIDDLSRRIEVMSALVRDVARRTPATQPPPREQQSEAYKFGGQIPLDAQYAAIDTQLRAIFALIQSSKEEGTEARSTLEQVKQLSDRLLVEMDHMGRRVDTGTAQHSAHLSTLLSRSTDSLAHLSTLASASTRSWFGTYGSRIGWIALGGVGGVLFAAWREKRHSDPWERKVL
ncbi:concanavalin A-like lectin/glucanase [Rhodotorula sp. JG-1b]|nr:concanavalin A-like lectin/glucanase [Rhodotorula sp. JG-1b]